jgi:uncharacterized protein (TIGR03000 family)
MKPNWKCLLLVAVVALALSSTASQASACWACNRPVGYWGGCYNCATPAYTAYTPVYRTVSYAAPCCDSGWYLGVRPGPVRRFFFGPYRWYWGGGYFAGCYTGNCASWSCDSCGDGTAAPAQSPTPAKKLEPTPAAPAPAPGIPAPAAAPKTSGMSAGESGILTVWVPYDAKVTINGRETSSKGSRRQFVSYGLQTGLSYKYEIKAQIVRDGQTMEDTRTVVLKAGDVSAVAFGFNVSAEQQLALTK